MRDVFLMELGEFLRAKGQPRKRAREDAATAYGMVLDHLLENVLDPKTTAKDIIFRLAQEREDLE